MLRCAVLLALLVTLACTQRWPCSAGELPEEHGCLDPARRHEPSVRLDQDNVVDFGVHLQHLRLPEPPRSGFRIVIPPRTLQPGEEQLYCVSWPFPALHNRVVYAGRLYTTRGLHHSNVFARPVDPSRGPNPYPSCHPGADDPFRDLPRIIPDVLFGNSTQVEGTEALVFPEGLGYAVDTTGEIISSVHILNPTPAALRVEVAYDFFTMPREQLVEEVVPFQMSVNQFRIPPGTRRTVSTECDVFGGRIVSLMMHTHRLATGTAVVQRREGAPDVLIYEGGPYDTASDIRVYDPPLQLEPFDRLRFSCDFHNTLDREVRFGLGDNEMCVLFGYLAPPQQQVLAFADDEDRPCRSFHLGAFRR
ncbi:MAG: hypothetical protein RMK29_12715 [Myxococcales bacterium]|nr:hypothetical protein [Myxococcota bacterium]MDW8282567.1 hypothetical protein [Myxococcales bacterium]